VLALGRHSGQSVRVRRIVIGLLALTVAVGSGCGESSDGVEGRPESADQDLLAELHAAAEETLAVDSMTIDTLSLVVEYNAPDVIRGSGPDGEKLIADGKDLYWPRDGGRYSKQGGPRLVMGMLAPLRNALGATEAERRDGGIWFASPDGTFPYGLATVVDGKVTTVVLLTTATQAAKDGGRSEFYDFDRTPEITVPSGEQLVDA
jgi:hypothetical protein